MGKNRKGKGRSDGFLSKLVQPWKRKKQRVTLTKAGTKQAPMKKGKAGKKQGDSEPARPKSLRERQVQELKTLAKIGKRDPERLAVIISKMLQEAMAQDEDARLKFERLIWEKAEKHRSTRDPEDRAS